MPVALLGTVHEKVVFNRRVSILAEALGALIPPGSTVLDVGTGDGQIAEGMAAMQPGVRVEGIDIMKRPKARIPVTLFDGTTIPFADKSFDVVTFVDVLHHTDDAAILVKEAARVARRAVALKDHLSENVLDHTTLKVMDWVGNAPHGVVLPYNYLSRARWEEIFDAAGLGVDRFETSVPLYPWPASAVFGRGLHFVARLTPRSGS